MVKTYSRLLIPPKSSFFLLGIRGVGKTQWIRSTYPEAHLVDLRDERLYGDFLVNPGLFRQELRALPDGEWVIVDEIQRLPHLLNEVHRAIDEKKLRFALLGSSARKIRREGVNLLGGRASSLYLYPFTPTELGDDFILSEILRSGSIPLVYCSEDKELTLASYVQTYLKEEVQAEALVRNLPGFARFLSVVGLFHGQTLNAEGIARDAGVARSTVQGYLSILEDTLLSFSLRAYEGRLRVREKRHPKFYIVDPGLVRALKRTRGLLHAEETGILFEGLIIQMVRSYSTKNPFLYDELYYWSAGAINGTVKVDLIIQQGDALIAVEIKSGTTPHERWMKGLRAISTLKGISRKIIVYLGERRLMTEDGIEILPLRDFIALLDGGKF
jgi:uncharacterized protein